MKKSKGVVVKIMGERNTGTNYLVKLLNSNLHIKFLRGTPTRIIHKIVKYNLLRQNMFFWLTYGYILGWKHSGAPKGAFLKLAKLRNIHFITLSKNPYSWLLSLYKNPYQEGIQYNTFQEFLKCKWPVSFMDNISNKKINPIELWNEKNKLYMKLAGDFDNVLNLKYEDIVKDPIEIQLSVKNIFKLAAKKKIENIDTAVKWDTDNGFDYYKDYYLNEKWRAKLTEKDIELINQYLDKDLMQALGYEVL